MQLPLGLQGNSEMEGKAGAGRVKQAALHFASGEAQKRRVRIF